MGLFNPDDALNEAASLALHAAAKRGDIVICGLVYVELAAMPAPAGWNFDKFLAVTGVRVDWTMEEAIWREAARAGHDWYLRKRGGHPLPRRVPADFIIGAHALYRGADLLTFDARTFRLAFPKLKVITA